MAVPRGPPVPGRLPAPRAPCRCHRSHPRCRFHSLHVRRTRSAAPRWPAPSPELSLPAAPPASWLWWAPAPSPPASCSPGTRSARATGSGGATRPGTERGRWGHRCGGRQAGADPCGNSNEADVALPPSSGRVRMFRGCGTDGVGWTDTARPRAGMIGTLTNRALPTPGLRAAAGTRPY